MSSHIKIKLLSIELCCSSQYFENHLQLKLNSSLFTSLYKVDWNHIILNMSIVDNLNIVVTADVIFVNLHSNLNQRFSQYNFVVNKN